MRRPESQVSLTRLIVIASTSRFIRRKIRGGATGSNCADAGMCGRMKPRTSPVEATDFVGLARCLDLVSRYNIARTQAILMVLYGRGERAADFAEWGLIPRCSKNQRARRLCWICPSYDWHSRCVMAWCQRVATTNGPQ